MAIVKKRSEIRNTKLSRVAADLFLKHGYEGVSVDRIVALAGGSKSTVYSEFGGKCGLFIHSIGKLCRDSTEPLREIDYAGLDLEASLKRLAFGILKMISAKRSVELYRLSISEAGHCPEVGEAWYRHGPARTACFIRQVLERHSKEVSRFQVPVERLAIIFHDALTGDILYRLLSGVVKRVSEDELRRQADAAVDLFLQRCGG